MSYNITVEGGKAVRLKTAGKYCDRDIVVTAEGGGNNTEIVDAIIGRTISEVSSDTIDIGLYAFTYCKRLSKINFPNAITIQSYCFQYCESLANVTLPKVQSVGGYGFMSCTSLVSIDMPRIRSVSNYAFRKCTALTRIDLYETYSIGTFTFYECANLETLILRKTDKVCTLSAINALQYTKIEEGTGFIYVPKDLVDEYKSATNWSTYADQIRAIEDYPDVCEG